MLTIEFLLTSLIIVLVPGTGAIFTISSGLFRGWRASAMAAIGCTLGILPHLLAAIGGLSFVLHSGATFFLWLRWIGFLYLLYLAWMMWQEGSGIQFEATQPQMSDWKIVGKAILINLLNPKLTLFFFAFLPLFLSPDPKSAVAEMMRMSAVFMLITLLVFLVYGALASSVRTQIINSPQRLLWLQRSFALAFALLGLKLALGER